MVKMINDRFGNEMWVDDSRVNEYIVAGNRRADEPAKQNPQKKQSITKRRAAKK